MSRSGCEKDKQRDVVRALAVQDLQLLLGAEPHLAKAFRVLSRRSKSDELRAICKEGVSYTLMHPSCPRHLRAWPVFLRTQDVPPSRPRARKPTSPSGLPERISHFGLPIYTSIDRHLRLARVPEARRVLRPSTKEKREAIGEM